MMARSNLSHLPTAVPSDVRPKYEAVTALTDAFCERHLNDGQPSSLKGDSLSDVSLQGRIKNSLAQPNQNQSNQQSQIDRDQSNQQHPGRKESQSQQLHGPVSPTIAEGAKERAKHPGNLIDRDERGDRWQGHAQPSA